MLRKTGFAPEHRFVEPVISEDVHSPGMSDSPHSTQRIVELDGIRGLAILAVLCCHLGYLVFFGWRDHLVAKLAERVFGVGWLGVDVFFVLSGFLITGVLLKAKPGAHFWRNFYLKRAFRILPVFLLVFGVTLLFITPPSRTVLLAYLLFMANWTVVSHTELMPLNHVWSLAVEEQFYFIWPGFVRWLSVRALFRVSVAVIVVTIVLRIVLVLRGVDSYIPYKITPTHVDGLAIGAIIALLPALDKQQSFLRRNCRLIIISAAVIWVTAFVVSRFNFLAWNAKATIFSIPATAVVTGMAIMSATDGTLLPRIQELLANHVVGWFGRRSYAIYLIHEPLDQAAQYLIQRTTFKSWRSEAAVDAVATLLVVGLSLSLAELSWRLIESRCLGVAARLTKKREVLLEGVSS